jgi:hypothetical protein
MTWQSRSRVGDIDSYARRFTYRTRNADGNPSYADWKWEVVGLDSISQVTVSWDLYLKTLDRRLLAGPIRKRQLRKEVAESLSALHRIAAAPNSEYTPQGTCSPSPRRLAHKCLIETWSRPCG